jgi:hypothetical protein
MHAATVLSFFLPFDAHLHHRCDEESQSFVCFQQPASNPQSLLDWLGNAFCPSKQCKQWISQPEQIEMWC